MTIWMFLLTAIGIFFSALIGAFSYWRFSYFLRDPHRAIPDGAENIVCAADGFVTYVKRVEDGEVPIAVKGRRSIPLVEFTGCHDTGLQEGRGGYLIGVYMTEHSVHRNRAPIAGRVVFREHRSAFPMNRSMARMTINLLFRRRPYDDRCEYLVTNERLTIGIRHSGGAVVFVTQIADLWINRIVARVAVGDTVDRGQQYGLIRFGSQCDVFLPDEIGARIVVSPGQYVFAGQSILAVARNTYSATEPCRETYAERSPAPDQSASEPVL